jgi:deazaflavin-dependent oxidoreductase (nitroreductase family)
MSNPQHNHPPARLPQIVDNPDEGVAEHIREYVTTDGRRGQWLAGWKAPTLLLVTRGRRSGKLRRTALAYGEDDGRYVLVASNGGAKRHPDWYLNLAEDPAVQVQVADDRFAARGRDARADERPALWKLMTSIGPELEEDRRKAREHGREIPVVILERIEGAAPGETKLGTSRSVRDVDEAGAGQEETALRQIAGAAALPVPDDPDMWVCTETIYRWPYVAVARRARA